MKIVVANSSRQTFNNHSITTQNQNSTASERNSTEPIKHKQQSFSQEKGWTGRSCGVQSGRARSLALERARINDELRSRRMLKQDGTKRKGKIREQEQLQLCLVVRSIEPASLQQTANSCSLGSVCSKSKLSEKRTRREGKKGGRTISKKFTRNVQRMPRKEDSLTFGTPAWRALPLDYDRSGFILLSFRSSGSRSKYVLPLREIVLPSHPLHILLDYTQVQSYVSKKLEVGHLPMVGKFESFLEQVS